MHLSRSWSQQRGCHHFSYVYWRGFWVLCPETPISLLLSTKQDPELNLIKNSIGLNPKALETYKLDLLCFPPLSFPKVSFLHHLDGENWSAYPREMNLKLQDPRFKPVWAWRFECDALYQFQMSGKIDTVAGGSQWSPVQSQRMTVMTIARASHKFWPHN